MSMHVPDISFGHETEAISGAFEVASPSLQANVLEAHRLACEIERLLTPSGAASERDGYGPRLARALARSLIDQLSDLTRPRAG